MASKAELLVQAAELGVEGLTEKSSIKQINDAIKAKQTEISKAAEDVDAGADEGAPQEGMTKHKLLVNVKHNGVLYETGKRAMLSVADVELFRAKGFIATPDADDESEMDAQPEKAKGSDKGDDEDEGGEGDDAGADGEDEDEGAE